MQLPPSFLKSLHGINGFDENAFVQVHESGEQVTSVRLNPNKLAIGNKQLAGNPQNSEIADCRLPVAGFSLPIASPVPWSSYGYYLSERPFFTFDPLLHAGAYYVQEASGMFLEQAIKQTVDVSKPLRVLDLCAAPGGKSTLLQSLLSNESVLVSNEVIKSRAAILEENCTKWGGANVIVTNNDPKDFTRLENFFDVIVIDAPCSGSGLFRREPEAINEWSEDHVQLCSRRQQRILADVYPSLKQNGILIYCTCSYSREEDEDMLDWMADELTLSERRSVHSLQLTTEPSWNIVEVQSRKMGCYGYRFFPDKIKGEGFFIGCFRKTGGETTGIKAPKKSSLQKISKKEMAIVQPWVKLEIPVQYWKQGEWILAFPESVEKELLTIVENLYVRRAGVTIGKTAGDELIPQHALAVSTIISDETVAVSLKKEEALQYLRKEDVNTTIAHKGWALARYGHCNLGWIKLISNRVNNYYPKEWRILKSAGN